MDKREQKREGAIKKNSKKRAARRKKRIIAFFCVFIFILLCVGAVLSATILFPVKNIVVSGDSIYSKQQIISASAVTDEDNIIMLSSKNVEDRISKNLPYSSEIKVEKVFPDTLKITVNTAVPKYFTACKDGYYILDNNFKVVEIKSEIPADCIFIKCNETEAVEAGDKFSLADEDSKFFEQIFELAEKNDVNITGINVSEPLDLQIIVDGKILVEFGSDVNLDKKMTHFAFSYEKLSAESQGIMNLKEWTSTDADAFFKDVKLDVMNFCQLSIVQNAE